MGERFDRVVGLFERFVVAAERVADALEDHAQPKPASKPKAKPRKVEPAPEPDPELVPSETDFAAARHYAGRLGLVVKKAPTVQRSGR